MSWAALISLVIALVSWGTVAIVIMLFHGLPPLPGTGEARAFVAGAFVLSVCGVGLFADWHRE